MAPYPEHGPPALLGALLLVELILPRWMQDRDAHLTGHHHTPEQPPKDGRTSSVEGTQAGGAQARAATKYAKNSPPCTFICQGMRWLPETRC